jgi:hypothetical protein
MREGDQKSWKNLPVYIQDITYLATDSSRVDLLKFHNKRANIVDLGVTDGIADTRQKIIEKYKCEKIFIVDDQCLFYERNQENKLIRMNEKTYESMLLELENNLDKYIWVGISDRAGNNRVLENTKEIQRSYSCYGINTKTFKEHDLSFDGMYKKTGAKNFEDFYALLSLLTKGKKNLMLYKFAFSHKHGKKGGNSEFRNNQTHELCYKTLQKEFPQFVKLKYKMNPSWTTQDGDNKRLEAVIQWKKAYESRKKNSL